MYIVLWYLPSIPGLLVIHCMYYNNNTYTIITFNVNSNGAAQNLIPIPIRYIILNKSQLLTVVYVYMEQHEDCLSYITYLVIYYGRDHLVLTTY